MLLHANDLRGGEESEGEMEVEGEGGRGEDSPRDCAFASSSFLSVGLALVFVCLSLFLSFLYPLCSGDGGSPVTAGMRMTPRRAAGWGQETGHVKRKTSS